MLEVVVVPLDGSPAAEQILPNVEELAAKFGSHVILVHVVPVLAQLIRETHRTSRLISASTLPVVARRRRPNGRRDTLRENVASSRHMACVPRCRLSKAHRREPSSTSRRSRAPRSWR